MVSFAMKTINSIIFAAGIGAAVAASPFSGDACTRVVYRGLDNIFVVARSLDWKSTIPTNLYVYPRGMDKVSSNLPNYISWTSKYASVYAVSYDGGITEGMNEMGLVVNSLFCRGTIYNNPDSDKEYVMSLAVFPAWILDLCASVDDVKSALANADFDIQGATFDGGTVSALHWGVTDADGNSIIFEFNRGVISVYDMDDYLAMTNDPKWPEMTAILDYWNKVGGQYALPGTVSSPDRCVRANFFAHHVSAVADPNLAVSIARSVLMCSCVPYTYNIESEPNVSSTQWRSYSNLKDKCYYFEIVTNPGYFFIDLPALNPASLKSVLKLDTSNTSDVVGCANQHLKRAHPFNPMY